jgi:general stress protein 26
MASTNGSGASDFRKLRRLIKDIDVAMLTTVTHAGMLRSRPMAVIDTSSEGQVWFFTRSGSEKADDVRDNQRVNLSFADGRSDRYVSVSGTAAIVHDVDRVRELWSKKLKAWFPLGKKDPELALLRIDVESAEYWDGETARFVPLGAFRPAASASTSPAPSEMRRAESSPEPAVAPLPPGEGRGGAQG